MKKWGHDDKILQFIFLYIIFFGWLSLIKDNTEFFYYSIVALLALVVLFFLHKRVRFPLLLLVSLALWGALHFIGGLVHIEGVVIYELTWFGLGYDNYIHLVSSFIVTIIAYSLLEPGLNKKIKGRKIYLGILLGLIGFGVAAVGEIVELAGVIFLGNAGVGDYLNNAIDLVFNGLGATLASILIVRHHHKKDLIKVKSKK